MKPIFNEQRNGRFASLGTLTVGHIRKAIAGLDDAALVLYNDDGRSDQLIGVVCAAQVKVAPSEDGDGHEETRKKTGVRALVLEA